MQFSEQFYRLNEALGLNEGIKIDTLVKKARLLRAKSFNLKQAGKIKEANKAEKQAEAIRKKLKYEKLKRDYGAESVKGMEAGSGKKGPFEHRTGKKYKLWKGENF